MTRDIREEADTRTLAEVVGEYVQEALTVGALQPDAVPTLDGKSDKELSDLLIKLWFDTQAARSNARDGIKGAY